MEVSDRLHVPAALPQGKYRGSNLKRWTSWKREYILPLPRFDRRTVQFIAGHYSDCAKTSGGEKCITDTMTMCHVTTGRKMTMILNDGHQ